MSFIDTLGYIVACLYCIVSCRFHFGPCKQI